MAVFRVEKTGDYTVMSNHHLKNRKLSLRAKGLLSLMLSLPEDWDYTLKGLACINREGVDAIRMAIRELETEGYIIRSRVRNEKGQLADTEYIIHEKPILVSPTLEKPMLENPIQVKPTLEKPTLENPTQLSTKELNTDLSNTKVSNPIQSNPKDEPAADRNGMEQRALYREIILENIEYEHFLQNNRFDIDKLNEVVDLMVNTVCTSRKIIRIAGDDYPAEVVKSKFLKLDSGHIDYVFECMKNNTTYVRNIKKYMLAVLFNAPSTIDSYYSVLVNHDMYGGVTNR
ncbi:MAG: DUF6017 domain-containing protein [Lachnospiraceae bacterium]|nr:DUF6017 domain-containing protein [Lachnospiraceae bacterium]